MNVNAVNPSVVRALHGILVSAGNRPNAKEYVRTQALKLGVDPAIAVDVFQRLRSTVEAKAFPKLTSEQVHDAYLTSRSGGGMAKSFEGLVSGADKLGMTFDPRALWRQQLEHEPALPDLATELTQWLNRMEQQKLNTEQQLAFLRSQAQSSTLAPWKAALLAEWLRANPNRKKSVLDIDDVAAVLADRDTVERLKDEEAGPWGLYRTQAEAHRSQKNFESGFLDLVAALAPA